ncbi:MAG: hypothetical protein KTR20_07355 [Cellvibrionaceae bacterium]|nr:hypothetical protein [Cellvibrionaceae bacterium]
MDTVIHAIIPPGTPGARSPSVRSATGSDAEPSFWTMLKCSLGIESIFPRFSPENAAVQTPIRAPARRSVGNLFACVCASPALSPNVSSVALSLEQQLAIVSGNVVAAGSFGQLPAPTVANASVREMADINFALAERIRDYAIERHTLTAKHFNTKHIRLEKAIKTLRHLFIKEVNEHRDIIDKEKKYFFGVQMRKLMLVGFIYVPTVLIGIGLAVAGMTATGGGAIALGVLAPIVMHALNRHLCWPTRKAVFEPLAGASTKREIQRKGHYAVISPTDQDRMVDQFFNTGNAWNRFIRNTREALELYKTTSAHRVGCWVNHASVQHLRGEARIEAAFQLAKAEIDQQYRMLSDGHGAGVLDFSKYLNQVVEPGVETTRTQALIDDVARVIWAQHLLNNEASDLRYVGYDAMLRMQQLGFVAKVKSSAMFKRLFSLNANKETEANAQATCPRNDAVWSFRVMNGCTSAVQKANAEKILSVARAVLARDSDVLAVFDRYYKEYLGDELFTRVFQQGLSGDSTPCSEEGMLPMAME